MENIIKYSSLCISDKTLMNRRIEPQMRAIGNNVERIIRMEFHERVKSNYQKSLQAFSTDKQLLADIKKYEARPYFEYDDKNDELLIVLKPDSKYFYSGFAECLDSIPLALFTNNRDAAENRVWNAHTKVLHLFDNAYSIWHNPARSDGFIDLQKQLPHFLEYIKGVKEEKRYHKAKTLYNHLMSDLVYDWDDYEDEDEFYEEIRVHRGDVYFDTDFSYDDCIQITVECGGNSYFISAMDADTLKDRAAAEETVMTAELAVRILFDEAYGEKRNPMRASNWEPLFNRLPAFLEEMLDYENVPSSYEAVIGKYKTEHHDFEINNGILETYNGDIGNVHIPECVTKIGMGAFKNCKHVKMVQIPESVTSIGNEAFEGCENLVEITLLDGITSIGEDAFRDCKRLKSIRFPDGVTCIDTGVVENCESLTEVILPDRISSIGEYAFQGCKQLKSIIIPDGVTSIKRNTFRGCNNLTIHASLDSYARKYAEQSYIPFASTTAFIIKDGVLKECGSSDRNVIIPDGVTRIGKGSFTGNRNVANVKLPNSVTKISNYAFNRCWSLENISLPSGLKSIGAGAFRECIRLKTITIPESISSIETHAFSECRNLASINLPSGLVSIGECAFSECGNLASINLPDGLISIGEWAFTECSNLSWIAIPNSITRIERRVFKKCSSLINVTLPDKLSIIDQYAFSGCSSLTTIVIPESTARIEWCAFEGCSNLSRITIPSSVTFISGSTFNGCKNLTIYGPAGSYAEQYAKKQSIPFIAV